MDGRTRINCTSCAAELELLVQSAHWCICNPEDCFSVLDGPADGLALAATDGKMSEHFRANVYDDEAIREHAKSLPRELHEAVLTSLGVWNHFIYEAEIAASFGHAAEPDIEQVRETIIEGLNDAIEAIETPIINLVARIRAWLCIESSSDTKSDTTNGKTKSIGGSTREPRKRARDLAWAKEFREGQKAGLYETEAEFAAEKKKIPNTMRKILDRGFEYLKEEES